MSRAEDDTSTNRSAPEPEPAQRVETPWIPVGATAERREADTPTPEKTPKPPREPKPAKPPRERVRLAPIDGHLAAAVTGLIVGGWLVLSTFATLRMCESLRSSSSCGGPGVLLLLVIMVVGVVLGAALLRLFRVRSSGSMSFLAVALVAVLVLVFFAGSLDRWWAIPVVAVLTVASYSLSHWMTTTYIDPAE